MRSNKTIISIPVQLSLALMLPLLLTGCSGFFDSQPQPTEPFFFVDATQESGLHHRHPHFHTENTSYLEIMGGGVAVGDVDGDGFDDLFFPTMPSFRPNEPEEYRSRLYRNNGDGTFTDITDEAGLSLIQGYPMGALFFDFNNNGMQDLYVAAYDGGQLFENRDGYFVDITEQAGLSLDGLCGNLPCMAAAASATDYNKNGHLDLFVVNNVSWDINSEFGYGLPAILPFHYRAQPTLLFRNNGDGTFTNVSEESGVTNRDRFGHGNDGKGLSAVWTDVNNNGWPDVYIANDTTPSMLYVNNRDGTFREISVAANLAEVKSSMGIDTGDYNNNGLLDLTTTNLEGEMVSLFRNYGSYRFDYYTASANLLSSARGSGWGVLFVDLDSDGYLDMVLANGSLVEQMKNERENENIFFQNRGDNRFRDVSERVIHFSNDEYSRGLAILDVQNNGKPDLIIANLNGAEVQLLVNHTKNDHNRIRIDLQGTQSNRDAVGARVYVTRDDGLEMNQLVKAGNSYQSTSRKSLFFGMGESEISEVRVEWPSGRVDTFTDLPVNRILRITEGADEDESSEVAVQEFNEL